MRSGCQILVVYGSLEDGSSNWMDDSVINSPMVIVVGALSGSGCFTTTSFHGHEHGLQIEDVPNHLLQ